MYTTLICGDDFTGLYIRQTLSNSTFVQCAVCYILIIPQSDFFFLSLR